MKWTLVIKILDIVNDVLCSFFADKKIKSEDKPKDSKDNQ
jgi:hypothetical protein